MTTTALIIPERFRGPPRSGNGGYVSGALSRLLSGGRFALPDHGAVEVTLRAPVPLDREMRVEHDTNTLSAQHDGTLIAEAILTALRLDVPEPATWEQALAVRAHSPSLRVGVHPMLGGERTGVHPVCFCCGAELAPDQGLHVYAAHVAERAQVAAAWSCDRAFADAAGLIPEEIVCAALDCPGQFAWLAAGTRTGMLGRFTARVERRVRAGERCVVTGWTLGNEGRKFYAGTALFDERAELCAYAKAVWIGR